MPNTVLQLLGILSNLQGAKVSSSRASGFSASTSTASTLTTADFATVMHRLNYNVDNASTNSPVNIYNPSSSQNLNNNIQTSISPNISAIVKKINKNKNSLLGAEGQIREYLLENYGGSESAVIRNLAGVQNLPTQMLTIQGAIFNQIVTKLSIQARESMYSSYNATSLYGNDSESADSDDSTISSENNNSIYSYWL